MQPNLSPSQRPGGRIFASPLARRLARRDGVDLARIAGTGPRGRVRARDVEMAIARGTADKSPAPREARHTPPPLAPDPAPIQEQRPLLAEGQVAAAAQPLPFHLTAECDISALQAFRTAANATASTGPDGGPRFRLSLGDFAIKALARALAGRAETGNAIGVAVRVNGSVVTAAIADADRKSLSAVSMERRALASDAGSGIAAAPRPLAVVFSAGCAGPQAFSVPLAPSQAFGLGVGAAMRRATVRDDAVAVVEMLTITLSCDARAIDVPAAAGVLAAVKALLESPMSLVA